MLNRPSALLALLLTLSSGCLPAGYGAAAILRPFRLPRFDAGVPEHRALTVRANGVTLRGWLFEPKAAAPRGLVVFLHGKDNNRALGARVAERFVPRGFAVLAYDQRAHGESGGKFCTYGVQEKRDLRRMLDTVGIAPVAVIGHSLGGAVALQAAAEDPRIRAVVAMASFATLDEIVRDRVPAFAGPLEVAASIAEAERQGRFRFWEASPVRAASALRAPTLLIHGTADAFTAPAHSRRIYDALPADLPKRLLSIDGAGHENVVQASSVWDATTEWIETHVKP